MDEVLVMQGLVLSMSKSVLPFSSKVVRGLKTTVGGCDVRFQLAKRLKISRTPECQ